MAEYEDVRSPYVRIAADLRAKIMSEEFAPGDDLPTTADLTKDYGAANATIQKALAMLKTEGWIVGTRGLGRQVRQSQVRVVTAGTYFDPEGSDITYKLLDVRDAQPVGDVLEQLPAPGAAVLRHRLMYGGDVPLEVDWSYYPADIAAGTEIARKPRIRGGVQRVLAELGLPEGRFEDVVTARDATDYEARCLLLPPGVPVLRVLRTVYCATDEDRVVAVSVMVKAGHQLAQRYVQAPRP